MKKIPKYDENLDKTLSRSIEESAILERIEREAIANFKGQLTDLEAALGVLRIGGHLGWRPLVLIHNKRTIRKYEEILNINIREFFPEEGPSWERPFGYVMAKKIGNFWKAVSGEIKIERKKEID
ncbi:MAG: hypothetical protein VX841_12060 [Pseudomonadota bacterium]|nr:hypothetical protein [Pseudomonadota bacterium]